MYLFLKILLWIFIAIIALILWILICPICYKIYAEKNPEKMLVKIRGSYLLGLLRFGLDYPSEKDAFYIKILFFRLGNKKEKANKKVSKKKEKPTKDESSDISIENSHDETSNLNQKDSINDDNTTSAAKITESTASCKEKDSGKEAESSEKNTNAEDKAKSKSKKSNTDKSDDKKQKNKEEKVPFTAKLKRKYEDLKFYKYVLEKDMTKNFIKDTYYRILRLLKKILPRKIWGKVLFGGKTPDVTGYAMAGYGIISTKRFIRKNLEFIPNFEEAVLEGNIHAKGHICIGYILIQACKIYFDKRFKRIRQVVKKHKIKNS